MQRGVPPGLRLATLVVHAALALWLAITISYAGSSLFELIPMGRANARLEQRRDELRADLAYWQDLLIALEREDGTGAAAIRQQMIKPGEELFEITVAQVAAATPAAPPAATPPWQAGIPGWLYLCTAGLLVLMAVAIVGRLRLRLLRRAR